MKSNFSFIYSFFLVVGDFLALVSAFIVAYVIRVKLDPRPLFIVVPAKTYLGIFLVLLPFWLLVFTLIGLYNKNIYEKRFNELGRLFTGSVIGLLSVLAYAYMSKRPIFPSHLVPLYGFMFAFGFLVIFRNLARFIRRLLFTYGIGISNVLLVGDTTISKELIDSFSNVSVSGYHVLGIVGSSEHTKVAHIKHFASFEEALKAVGKNIHSIIQTVLYADTAQNNEILTYAQEHHTSYRFIPGNTELFVGNIDVELFQGSVPVVAVHQTALIGWGRILKRIFDVAASAVLLIVISPFLLLIAVFVKLLDPKGPVFFRQTRLTRFNSEFRVFKFRTHKAAVSGLSDKDAFAKIGQPDLYETYKDNGYALANDPRHTAIGRFLRKTTLDELPQLFNVLKGDISLVGPRPLIAEELDTYEKKHMILSVKSGLTGLAQVSGRQNISFEERRKLDMYYVQNWSFWLDLVILIKTIRVVLERRGAQ